jgi:hypothetical protein
LICVGLKPDLRKPRQSKESVIPAQSLPLPLSLEERGKVIVSRPRTFCSKNTKKWNKKLIFADAIHSCPFSRVFLAVLIEKPA